MPPRPQTLRGPAICAFLVAALICIPSVTVFMTQEKADFASMKQRMDSMEDHIHRLTLQLADTRKDAADALRLASTQQGAPSERLIAPAGLGPPGAPPPPAVPRTGVAPASSCSPQQSTMFHGYKVCSGWVRGTHATSPVLPVTLVTQLSADRLVALERLVDAWQAPLSAAVYVDPAKWHVDETMLRTLLLKSQVCQKWLSLSIVFQHGYQEAYPIQTLRNLALNLSHGSVFLLDVDFIPSPRLAERAVARVQLYAKERPGVKVAFVVAAFQPTEKRSPNAVLPGDKVALMRERESGLVQPILHPLGEHASHVTTNYPRWYATTVDYSIPYEVLYEPYVIATMPGVPPYDERFNEYGNDKCAHVYEMAASRYQFVVISDAYIIHMGHGNADWKVVQDNDKAWKQWGDFMDEIQARYGWRPETPPRLQREVEMGYLPGEWMKPAVGVQ